MPTPFAGSLLLAASLVVAASPVLAQSTVYQTGFEAGDGFTANPLAGQDGWTVGSGTADVVGGSGANASSQFVQLGANSVASRAAANGANRAVVRGYYQGSGTATLLNPTGPNAAALAFRTLDASNVTLAAWNGTTNTWVEPAGPPALSNTAWHEVVVALNYTAKTFNVRVNGANYLENIPFDDNTVVSLNGISASSGTNAKIDSLGLFESGANGDYDGDGWTDQFETSGGNSNPLAGNPGVAYTPGEEPTYGDFDADNDHDGADAAILAGQIANGTASPATGDFQVNGAVDVRDVTFFSNRAAGIFPLYRNQ